MELDELSNNSTISNISNCQSSFIFDIEDYSYTPHIEELQPKIENIISSVNFVNNLNLKNISLKLKNAEYNSNKSSTLTLRTKDNKVTAAIFSNGKMICSGAK